MSRYLRGVLLVVIIGLFVSVLRSGQPLPLEKIKLPPGFSISIYATGVPNAREMALGTNGTLFVGSREAGNVYAIVDRDKDSHAEVIKIAQGLKMPSGVAFHDGSLYVAEVSRVLRYVTLNPILKPRQSLSS